MPFVVTSVICCGKPYLALNRWGTCKACNQRPVPVGNVSLVYSPDLTPSRKLHIRLAVAASTSGRGEDCWPTTDRGGSH